MAHLPRLISPLDAGLEAERVVCDYFSVLQHCLQVSEVEVDVQKRLLGGLACQFDVAQPAATPRR